MGTDQSFLHLIQNKPVQAGPRLALLILVAGAHVAAAIALLLSPALEKIQREAPEPLSVRLFEESRPPEQIQQPANVKTNPATKPQTEQAKTEQPREALPAPVPTAQPSPAVAAPAPAAVAPAPPPTREVATREATPNSVAPAAAPARTAVSIDAAYAGSNPKPPYPPMARRLGEEGTVTLRILVNSDGMAAKVEIKKSSGSSLLDKSAEQTIKQWRFVPAKLDGKAVEEWYETRWTFKLES